MMPPMGCAGAGTLLTLLLAAPGSAPPSPAPSARPQERYDAFMRAEPAPRGAAFARLAAEEKAELMTTHMRRYQRSRRASLSDEQSAVIDANLAALRPDFYRQPVSREWRDRAVALFLQAREVFSREELMQVFSLDGDYIPPGEEPLPPQPAEGALSPSKEEPSTRSPSDEVRSSATASPAAPVGSPSTSR
jgi:hypothetical protein